MKRGIAAVLALVVLGIVWWRVDPGAMLAALAAADMGRLALGLFMVVPLTLATAWRLALVARVRLPLVEATRLILSASTLNLVLPSKMGDIAKSWALRQRHGVRASRALALVGLEKALDLASLVALGLVALLLAGRGLGLAAVLGGLALAAILALLAAFLWPRGPLPRLMRWAAPRAGSAGSKLVAFADALEDLLGWFWSQPRRAAGVLAFSVLLWAGHLVQMWLFASALAPVPLVAAMAAATLAILVGLLPLTMAGVGTRDAALILFFAPWLSPPAGAALGVLATMRYILPALAGAPFMSDYLVSRQREPSTAPRAAP